MRRALGFLLLVGVICCIPTLAAHAQRGVGANRGMASGTDAPPIVTFQGTLVAVISEPCQATTGRASVGTHVLLRSPESELLNIHLGPIDEVVDIANQLTVNRKVTVDCFCTAKMAKNHYVAVSVKIGRRVLELRDENLRPTWAGTTAGSSLPDRNAAEVTRASRRGNGRGGGWGRYGRGGQGPGWERRVAPGDGRGWAWVDANGDGVCDQCPRR